jgi:Ca-activated chloride channel family protein
VQFNQQRVAAYRLIGYENRALANADFADDRKDAGEIGSGHMMTVLYEIVPAGMDASMLTKAVAATPETASETADATGATTASSSSSETAGGKPGTGAQSDSGMAEPVQVPGDQLMSLAIRYKQPEGEESSLLTFPVMDEGKTWASASADFRFAAAVAEFGMLLRRSPYRGNASFANVLDVAEGALGEDRDGYRRQFMELVRTAQALAGD